jgi:hypothetical protein
MTGEKSWHSVYSVEVSILVKECTGVHGQDLAWLGYQHCKLRMGVNAGIVLRYKRRSCFECVPDVSSISAAAGVPSVPDVLTDAGFPAFVGVPGVVGFPAVAFNPDVAGVSAVAVVPAVDGVFAVASFPADPGVPMFPMLL